MIRVMVTLPAGVVVPYSIDPLLPAKGLVRMAQMDERSTKICFKGKLLNMDLSLMYQGVHDGDKIVFYKGLEYDQGVTLMEETTTAQKICSLMKEAMRIDDLNMMRCEEFEDGSVEDSEGNEMVASPEKTIIVTNQGMGLNPLPVPWKEEEPTDSYDVPLKPYFSSIEETGKFLVKQIQDEWTW